MLTTTTKTKSTVTAPISAVKTGSFTIDMHVLFQDEWAHNAIPILKNIEVKKTPVSKIALLKNLFVFASTTQLSRVEYFVREANYKHRL
ncbi:MAG TPA: hypothetical protein VJM83_04925, partial [Nitrospirota bacterium]|nr:hypothetical protein [Nitrospirota bacterium]